MCNVFSHFDPALFPPPPGDPGVAGTEADPLALAFAPAGGDWRSSMLLAMASDRSGVGAPPLEAVLPFLRWRIWIFDKYYLAKKDFFVVRFLPSSPLP